MVELKTLANRSLFQYEGSVKDGIKILYGSSKNKKTVSIEIFERLLKNFSNKIVPIETTRTTDDLNEGSLGYWLNKHIKGPVITSYIASILVHEGYAEPSNKKLQFNNINE